jgi:hypothetical protein
MSTLYLCLGADSGPRVETLLRAASVLVDRLGACALTCSSVYADRHHHDRNGAVVNLMLQLDGVRRPLELVPAVLLDIEAQFGRERDPERKLPVPLDIDWIGTGHHGEVQWNAHYDRGRPFLWFGLNALEDVEIAAEIARIAVERDFTAADIARDFYPLVSGEYATGLVRATRHLRRETASAAA